MSSAIEQARVGGAAPAPTAAEAELAVQARQAPGRSRGYWAGVWRRVRRDPVTIACAAILLLMLLAIVFAPLLSGVALIGALILHQMTARDPLMPMSQLLSTFPIAGVVIAVASSAAAIVTVRRIVVMGASRRSMAPDRGAAEP